MKASNTAEPEQPPAQCARAGALRWIAGIGVIGTLAVAAFFCLCRYSDKVALLPAHRGAEWIIFPKPVAGIRETAFPVSAIFLRSFVLPSAVSNSTVKLYAYRSAALTVNGRLVALPVTSDDRWKSAKSADVSEFLRAGTNILSVAVTNASGPPALWLRLEAGNETIETDREWEVSLAGSLSEHASLANVHYREKPERSLQGSESTVESVNRIWPWLVVLLIVSLSLVFLAGRAFGDARNKFFTPGCALNYLLVLILLARFFICFHNVSLLPSSMGFDAEAHEDYIKFICDKHSLPLAKDGWEMFQPPLYYIAGAMVIGADGGYVQGGHTTSLLRWINGFVGLLECWLVLLCLNRLFPSNFAAQAAGLAVTAFLPPNLNLSQYVTNEPMGALCSTAAFYYLLRTFAHQRLSDYIWLGVFLGLAMLAKFSALIIVAGALGALALRMSQEKSTADRNFWRGPVATVLCVLAVAGWHYVRVWLNSGKPLVGNWEPTSPFAWRQDPGFHVAGYYFAFGKVLVEPLFSSFHGFFDGIYSTLWGDGLASGAARVTFRPPWNYDWVNAGYLLSAGLSAIIAVGIVLMFINFVRVRSAQWAFVLGSLGLFAVAILYMTLRVPAYGQVKAFYALPALVSFAAVFALGWNELIRRWPISRLPMSTLLVAWCTCVAISFWIQKENPETSLVHGLYFAERGNDAEALANLSSALEKDATAQQLHKKALLPRARVEGHFNLGLVLERQGQNAQALEHYREALKLDPDFDGALNNLAWFLATCSQPNLRNGAEAVALARRACALTQERTTVYIGTLAAAYAEAGNFPEAVAAAEKAINCAQVRGEEELARRNGELLNLYRAGKPYRESAGL